MTYEKFNTNEPYTEEQTMRTRSFTIPRHRPRLATLQLPRPHLAQPCPEDAEQRVYDWRCPGSHAWTDDRLNSQPAVPRGVARIVTADDES